MKQSAATLACLGMFFVVFSSGALHAADQPQWGRKLTRNMVSDEKGLPESFAPGRRDPATGETDMTTTKNVKWVAALGKMTYGTPIVAGGRVLVGTNNDAPRDKRIVGDRGVLMCFDEATGRFLWQLVVPKRLDPKWCDWQYIGLTSPPTVEGDRAYVVSNRGEVMCVDVEGMADGNDGPFVDEARHMAEPGADPVEPTEHDGDIIWLYDMGSELGVKPHNASNGSVLLDGNFLYVCTSNGVDWTHTKVLAPAAPTLIVLDKRTGKLVARDNFGIGGDIIHGQWGSPAMGSVGGKKLVYLGTGNGYLYACEAVDPNKAAGSDEPLLLEKLWWINGHPLAQTQDMVPLEHIHNSHSYEVTAMPVFYDNRVYAAFTQEPFHNMMEGWLTCLDATKTGDITRTGLLWSTKETGASISTVSIADGLVYAADFTGRVRCLDAKTGRSYWVHDAGRPLAGSTLVADGKVYFGTARQEFWVLAAGRKLKVISRIRMRNQIFSTPTAANGTLYIATTRHLYAVAE